MCILFFAFQFVFWIVPNNIHEFFFLMWCAVVSPMVRHFFIWQIDWQLAFEPICGQVLIPNWKCMFLFLSSGIYIPSIFWCNLFSCFLPMSHNVKSLWSQWLSDDFSSPSHYFTKNQSLQKMDINRHHFESVSTRRECRVARMHPPRQLRNLQ